MYKLIANLFSGKYWFADGYFPYAFRININGQTEYFQFRFQWMESLFWMWGEKSSKYEVSGRSITYSNKVWRAWNLRHNILYRLHYKYDRPAGMGIYAEIPYRWTINLKHKDKVSYIEDRPKTTTGVGWHV
jgi:hypothetical protein